MSFCLLSCALVVLNTVPAAARPDAPARFDFAPQLYPLEQAKIPVISHSVVPGRVFAPSGIGVDPLLLVKPVVPYIPPRHTFAAAFGRPRQIAAVPQPPVTAALPPSLASPRKAQPITAATGSRSSARTRCSLAAPNKFTPSREIMTYGAKAFEIPPEPTTAEITVKARLLPKAP
jgi:hypothetical protein